MERGIRSDSRRRWRQGTSQTAPPRGDKANPIRPGTIVMVFAIEHRPASHERAVTGRSRDDKANPIRSVTVATVFTIDHRPAPGTSGFQGMAPVPKQTQFAL